MGVAGGDDAVGADGPARRAPAPRHAPRATSWRRPAAGDEVEGPLDGPQDAGPARVVERERVRIRPSSTSRSCSSASASVVDDDQLGPVEPVERAVAGVAGEPSGDGRNAREIGFDAASTTSSTGPGRGDRHGLTAGWMPCTGPPLGVAHESLALEARGVGRKPRSISASTRPRPRRRDLAGEAEPGRPPRRPPAIADGRSARASSDGPASTLSSTPLGVDERQARSVSSPDPLLDELPVVVRLIVAGARRRGHRSGWPADLRRSNS